MKKIDPKKIVSKSHNGKPVSKEHARSKYYYSKIKEELEEVSGSESSVEAKIKQAMDSGLFDNLPGKGQPIDLRSYFAVPEHLRISYHILKNSNYLPEEVRLKKKMEEIKKEILTSTSYTQKKKLNKALADMSQYFSFCIECNKKR